MTAAAFNLSQLARMSAGGMLNGMLEGIAIGLFAWVVLRLVGRRNSSTRFAVWFSALLAIAALPVLGVVTSASALTPRVGAAITVPSWWALAICFGWALIAGVALLRVGVGLLQLRRLRASCTAMDAAALDPVLRATLAGFQAVRPVALCQSDRLPVPTAIGFLKPVVVIPEWALQELSAAELNSILIHELAHLRRWDDWTNLAQQILKALLFFHPAVWWIESQLTLEREMACDDAVLAETANVRAYAQCLISMAEKSFMRRGLALAQAAVYRMRQTSLRVAQILDVNRSRATRVWKPALYSVGAFFLVCLVSLSRAPELVAFQDPTSDIAIRSVIPANRTMASPGGPNSLEKPAVATAVGFRGKSAAETFLPIHGIRERTSSRVPQSAENKSGLQLLGRGISVQASLSAAAGGMPARPVDTRQSSASLLEAQFVWPDAEKLAQAMSVTSIDHEASQAIFVVMQSAQHDEAGLMFWRISVWHVTVLDASRSPVATRTSAKQI